jgi:hypothetical protein
VLHYWKSTSNRKPTKRESMPKRHHHRGGGGGDQKYKSEIKIKMAIYGDAIGA